MKVSLFDKKVLKTFLASLGLVETVLSIILIFVDVPQDTKIRSILALILLAAFVLDYVILIIAANTKKKASTTINSIQVKICVGDIFKQTGCLKVIPFNERFDTLVDNVIISEKSLNATANGRGDTILYESHTWGCVLPEPEQRIAFRTLGGSLRKGLLSYLMITTSDYLSVEDVVRSFPSKTSVLTTEVPDESRLLDQ